MQFTVGSFTLTVTQLGRMCVSGDTNSHVLALNFTNRIAIPMAGCIPGYYVYATLPNPVVLNPNSTNTLFSQEAAGGDNWDDWGQVTTNFGGTVTGLAYNLSDGNSAVFYPAPGYSYGPVDLIFTATNGIPPTITITSPAPNSTVSGTVNMTVNAQAGPGRTIASVSYAVDGVYFTPPLDTTKLNDGVHYLNAGATDSAGQSAAVVASESITVQNSLPAASLVTAQNPGATRNNTTGYFGMQFTTGSKPFTITRLGRMCAPGNSGLHDVLLYSASASILVDTFVSMAGCTPGAYVYGYLKIPILTHPNTVYVLVSQETAGGDSWHDWGTVTTTADATVNGMVYNLTNQFPSYNNFVPAANYSYGPVNFQYGGAYPSGTPPQVTITAPIGNVSGTVNPVAAVTPGSYPVQSTSWFADNVAFVPPLNTAMLANGLHAIQAQVTDSSGLSALGGTSFFSFNGAETRLLAAPPASPARTDTTGWFGMQFTTGNRHVYVSDLGRACISSSQPSTHVLSLLFNNGGSGSFSVPMRSATVTIPAVCTSPFVYVKLDSVADLAPNGTYELVSQEIAGGAPWHDWGSQNIGPLATGDGLTITGLAWALGANPPTVSIQTGDGTYTNFPIYSSSPGLNYSFVGLDLGYYIPQVR